MTKILDNKLALELAGGSQELADELLDMLIRDLPSLLESLNHAYETDDTNTLFQYVHKINGSSRYCGVPNLMLTADRLERSIREGNPGRIEEYVSQINAEVNALLRTYLMIPREPRC